MRACCILFSRSVRPPNTSLQLTHILRTYRHGPISSGSAETCGMRPSMEDAIVSSKGPHRTYFFGVFDGHGGSACSEYVSGELSREVLEMRGPVRPEDVIAAAIRVDEKACRSFEDGSCATFASVWSLGEGGNKEELSVLVGNLGDSRVLKGTPQGQCYELTKDHKPNDGPERLRIERAGGFVSPGSRHDVPRANGQLALSRAFGDRAHKQNKRLGPEAQVISCVPDCSEATLRKGEFLVLACDGVYEADAVSCQDVATMVAKALEEQPGDVSFAAHKVMAHALESGSRDNISCTVVVNTASHGGENESEETHRRVVLGPLYSMQDSFLLGYLQMLKKGGMGLEQALEIRYADNSQWVPCERHLFESLKISSLGAGQRGEIFQRLRLSLEAERLT